MGSSSVPASSRAGCGRFSTPPPRAASGGWRSSAPEDGGRWFSPPWNLSPGPASKCQNGGGEVSGEDLLIAQSRRGDTRAFDQLVDTYQHRIYDLVYRITGHHADAQDAAQEAFVKAYLGLRGFGGRGAFSTWLHRIAVNAALDVIRRRPAVDLRVPASAGPAVDPLADG